MPTSKTEIEDSIYPSSDPNLQTNTIECKDIKLKVISPTTSSMVSSLNSSPVTSPLKFSDGHEDEGDNKVFTKSSCLDNKFTNKESKEIG